MLVTTSLFLAGLCMNEWPAATPATHTTAAPTTDAIMAGLIAVGLGDCENSTCAGVTDAVVDHNGDSDMDVELVENVGDMDVELVELVENVGDIETETVRVAEVELDGEIDRVYEYNSSEVDMLATRSE